MKPTREEIAHAAYHGNLDLLRSYAARGADLNEVDLHGCSLFEDIVCDLCVDEKTYRYEVIRTLLALGADPHAMGEERSSPLLPAMLTMDTEMLRILLEGGADPNRAHGLTEQGMLYDYAEVDYRHEVFGMERRLKPTEEDKRDEDSWLMFLDRMAVQEGLRRPDYLFLLRQFGARSITEIRGHTEPAGGA